MREAERRPAVGTEAASETQPDCNDHTASSVIVQVAADLAALLTRQYTRIIDKSTPIGAYVRELERSERARSEWRVGEIELALDAVAMAARRLAAAR